MRVIGNGGPEPVTLEEFMSSVNMDEAVDPNELVQLLASAADVVERATNRFIQNTEVEIYAPSSIWTRWWLPVAPIVSLAAVEVLGADGQWEALAVSQYRLARAFDEPQLVWNGAGIAGRDCRVRVTTGYGGDRGALSLKRAVILLAKEWKAAQITATDTKPEALSFGVQRLIRQNRYRRPQETA